jgi:hypothetical protein
LFLLAGAPSAADRATCPQSRLISDAATLQRAIECASAGATLKLGADAQLGTLDLKGVKANGLVIVSSDSGRPAQFSGIRLLESEGITLRNLKIAGPMPPQWQNAIVVRRSRQVVLEGLQLTGSRAIASDSGVMVQESQDVDVRRLIVTGYRNGITLFNVRGVRVSENALHDLENDGIRGAGIEQAVIERNLVGNINPVAGGHADGIQFWSRNQKTASKGIVVRQNLMVRGRGQPFQGIFVRDSAKLPFRNLEISGNAVIGGNFHGISVNGADEVRVSRNVVVPIAPQLSWIRLQNTTNSEAAGNKAGKFMLLDQAKGRGNEVVNMRHDPTRDLRAWLGSNRLTRENFPVAILEDVILRGE